LKLNPIANVEIKRGEGELEREYMNLKEIRRR